MSRVTPQPGAPVNTSARGWRPTGDADAVWYLGGIDITRHDGGPMPIVVTLVPSLERQALRYLKPCSEKWYRRMPDHGGAMEDLRLRGFNTWLPEKLLAEATEQERPIGHFISPESPLAKEALMLRNNLEWIEAEPGIWAAYWVEPKAD
jgi:hypothetical protein